MSGTVSHQWQAETYDARSVNGHASRIPGLVLGFVLMTLAPAAVWYALAPSFTAETRFIADLAGPIGRAALAEASLRLAAMPSVSTSLDANGLVVTLAGQDAEKVLRQARSVSALVLDMTLPTTADRTEAPRETPRPQVPDAVPQRAMVLDRDRLRASLDAADGRLAAISAALTGVARDLAAGARLLPDRRVGRETLDKATVALADLQLQRIQLQSRYQDDFPAVVALEGQMRSVRAMISDETRKLEAARTVPDPADPILTSERDRLRSEQSQWQGRRATIVSDLADAERHVIDKAKLLPPPPLPLSEPAAVPPAPILVEAATTIGGSPDVRWWAMPLAAGAGLLCVLRAWFVPLRRFRSVRAALVLQRVEALLLAQDPLLLREQAETRLLLRDASAQRLGAER